MKWNDALKDYKSYLKIERGLAQNSIDNYSFDIDKLIKYLEDHKICHTPISITTETVQSFIYSISKTISARTQSRILSGLNGFFNYLVFEDYRQTNPLDTIDSPRIGRKLPDTLSELEIDALIKAIDLSKPQGERNRLNYLTFFLMKILLKLLVKETSKGLFPS